MRVHTFDDLEVAAQGVLEHWMPEETAIRYITHQQFHDHKKLVNCLIEAGSRRRWRRTSDSLKEIGMCSCVVQLHGSYAAQVVVIAGMLSVDCRRWEGRLRHKLVCLIIKIVVQIIAQEAVDQRCLSLVIVTEGSCPLCSEE